MSLATLSYACNAPEGHLNTDGVITCNNHVIHNDHANDVNDVNYASDCDWYDVDDTQITDCANHVLASASVDQVFCAQVVKYCKGQTDANGDRLTVSKNETNGCEFDKCPKPSWYKDDADKDTIKTNFDTIKGGGSTPSFKDVFNHDNYKNKTSVDKKNLKKTLFRDIRGEKNQV